MINVIRDLHTKGIKPRYIMQLVSALNRKLLHKLYSLLAPPEVIANSCLLVMGSEGREEQILKTDQDNAIILRDGFTYTELEPMTQEFTATLLDFGYPKCPGDIMVSNPYWTKPLSAFKEELVKWIHFPNQESHLRFAIFFDAMPVAGDTRLFRELREAMFRLLSDNIAFYSFFAKATLAFDTPLSFFGNFILEKNRTELDIKKGGIFPIVHGVRSLAMEYRLEQTNTIERIKALTQSRLFDQQLTIELIEVFAYLCALRARAGLQKLKLGTPQDNYLNPKELNTLERELLRDSFKIVNKFKQLIKYHFKLDKI
jgi:CBS domain-containing protein